MTPLERIIAQKDLIDLAIKHEYIPQSSNAAFGEIVSALRELNHNVRIDGGCSGCIMEIIKTANRLIKNA